MKMIVLLVHVCVFLVCLACPLDDVNVAELAELGPRSVHRTAVHRMRASLSCLVTPAPDGCVSVCARAFAGARAWV